MSIVTWDESFRINIGSIDSHHEHLVQLLNTAYAEFSSNAPPENLGLVLHELLNYSKYHFTEEEKHMKLVGYPAFQHHRDEHNLFIVKVTKLEKLFSRGEKSLSVETIVFLKNWIANHILASDAAFGSFVQEREVEVS
ncbi:hypothetical protein GMLC_23530 [Geomonas limicola]|uniref:Hemerythrin-like domain-containing protein n=1 Tax=Geomonas limicola TaxID=2740186 RepID=A0A6V8NA65_9BACT|nr:bacteriohemerythrin [Geomonas limicola]GFO68774.1 hypothetical protein GMLC_23530 [Geomonas limicola]